MGSPQVLSGGGVARPFNFLCCPELFYVYLRDEAFRVMGFNITFNNS